MSLIAPKVLFQSRLRSVVQLGVLECPLKKLTKSSSVCLACKERAGPVLELSQGITTERSNNLQYSTRIQAGKQIPAQCASRSRIWIRVGQKRHSSPRGQFFKLVEWSEQLRPVTLDAVRRRVQIPLCTEQRVKEKLVWNWFPSLDPCLTAEVFACRRERRFELLNLLLV